MPNRIIKDTICESRSLSETSLFAQDLYKRLITYADDYGRFNCDPKLVLARLYLREMDWLTREDIWTGIEELVSVGKIELYRVEDRRFKYDLLGYFPNWSEHQRIRDSKTKLPEPGEFNHVLNDWALRRFVPMNMKIFVLERDSFSCCQCGVNLNPFGLKAERLIKLATGTIHFDHVVPVKDGGRATRENIRTLCCTCNLTRARNVGYDEILEITEYQQVTANCAPPQKVAANCGESPPNPIQSESNPNPNPNPKGHASPRPTIEEVTAYCSERGNKVNPQRWYDYYTSIGWKVGRNPMKDWKAAVRTWENKDNGSRRPEPDRRNDINKQYDEPDFLGR